MEGNEIVVDWRHGGVWLPELELGLDNSRVQARAFVSHGHADHFARHKTIYCSVSTAAIIRARYGATKSEVIALEYGECHEIAGWELRLFPAGHILGSAMIHLTRPDGRSLLYTGDFKTRPGLASEVCEPVKADVLIMETTFGLPKFVLPPSDGVFKDLRTFCTETLKAGEVPILYAYSLGKAQEAHMAVAELGVPIMLHSAAVKMATVFRKILDDFPKHVPLNPENAAGHIVIGPPHMGRKPPLSEIAAQRTAMLTGWALNSSAKYRYRVDEVFPLSDHAGYPDLLDFVEDVDPSLTYCLHGYSKDFASDLRARGREAWCIHGNDQLELRL